jgi:hypothetical protein
LDDYLRLRLSHRFGTQVEEQSAIFSGFRALLWLTILPSMKTFTLTLYAKRKSDGTYDYSLNIWENRGSAASETNFESDAFLRQQVDAVLPYAKDGNQTLPEAQQDGDYWFPFTMPMSDAQAANLGWAGDGTIDRRLVN